MLAQQFGPEALYHLLLPAEKRPAVFFTGHNEYDAADVGLKFADDGLEYLRTF